jgi:hypothetical protein
LIEETSCLALSLQAGNMAFSPVPVLLYRLE